MSKQGAYILFLKLHKTAIITAGALGTCRLAAGFYLYVGSANRGIAPRIARHRRLAESKTGKMHWHIDFLLTHPNVRLVRTKELEGRNECAISRKIASLKGIKVPIPKFGSTDCRAGCAAHLYRMQSLNMILPE